MDRAWLEERIASTKALIVAYETALTTLAGGAQSYELDTGQTRTRVTKADAAEIRILLRELEARLDTYEARLCGAGVNVTPGF